MLRLLYIVVSYVVFVVVAPVLRLHPKTRRHWRQRLGLYRADDTPAPQKNRLPRLWLHGASAGDLLALFPMIELLRAKYPNAWIVTSAMTDSGEAIARGRLKSFIDAFVYVPFDLWHATQRAVNTIAPQLLVLEYTEMWPNLISSAKAKGSRIVMTNGRFHPGKVNRYRALFALTGHVEKEIDAYLMREESEAERARMVGVLPSQIFVTGNTKFDALTKVKTTNSTEVLREAMGILPEHLVLMAGSTHEGEEELLLDMFLRLRPKFPHLRMVIAPRYVERTKHIQALIEARQLSFSRRSENAPSSAAVVVLDTIGELTQAYALATVVFVGGSFVERGGQNILEPAAQGKPVLFGPRMENFRDSVQVLLGRGGLQANDIETLERLVGDLLSQPEKCGQLGVLARKAVESVSGASQRNVDIMSTFLDSKAVT